MAGCGGSQESGCASRHGLSPPGLSLNGFRQSGSGYFLSLVGSTRRFRVSVQVCSIDFSRLPAVVSDEQWVAAAAKAIEKEGCKGDLTHPLVLKSFMLLFRSTQAYVNNVIQAQLGAVDEVVHGNGRHAAHIKAKQSKNRQSESTANFRLAARKSIHSRGRQ
jgi:hypothetical protein